MASSGWATAGGSFSTEEKTEQNRVRRSERWTFRTLGPLLEANQETEIKRATAEIDLVAEKARIVAAGVAVAEQVASLNLQRVHVAAERHSQPAEDQRA